MVSGSRSVYECDPALARILKGPKNFLESLWDGRVDRKNFALMKACCPTMKSGGGALLASAVMSLVCSRREQTKTNLNPWAFSPQQNRVHSEERA